MNTTSDHRSNCQPGDHLWLADGTCYHCPQMQDLPETSVRADGLPAY